MSDSLDIFYYPSIDEIYGLTWGILSIWIFWFLSSRPIADGDGGCFTKDIHGAYYRDFGYVCQDVYRTYTLCTTRITGVLKPRLDFFLYLPPSLRFHPSLRQNGI